MEAMYKHVFNSEANSQPKRNIDIASFHFCIGSSITGVTVQRLTQAEIDFKLKFVAHAKKLTSDLGDRFCVECFDWIIQ